MEFVSQRLETRRVFYVFFTIMLTILVVLSCMISKVKRNEFDTL